MATTASASAEPPVSQGPPRYRLGAALTGDHAVAARAARPAIARKRSFQIRNFSLGPGDNVTQKCRAHVYCFLVFVLRPDRELYLQLASSHFFDHNIHP